MNLRSRLITCLFFTFGLAVAAENVTLGDGTELELKGIGVAQELRNDVYIGALYAPLGVDDINIIEDINTPKRMTLRYLANNYSYRKVARHWKERIAMNNARDKWQPLTTEIISFSAIFTENMLVGDEVVLDFIPGKGTLVFLNETLFETIESPGFFRLLMQAWIGSVPPNKAFKEGILGISNQQTQTRVIGQFNSLSPETGRFKLPEPELVVASVPVPVPVTKTPSSKPKSTASNQTKSKPKPKKTDSTKKKTEVAAKKPTEKKSPPKKVVAKKKPAPEPKKEVAQVKPKPKPKPVIVIDVDLIRGSYTRELIDHVRKNQTYPKKALARGEQGDGVAKVSIDPFGDLVEVSMIQKTGSRELDKGVMKMIKRSAPFPELPPELKQTEFEFEVPFSFQL